MSNLSTSTLDFDFWEFVACGRCQLPYHTPNGLTVPFWLTECGHIVCNNHLNADQSCSQCGAQQIELVPLQEEMEPPMSQWFQSIPVWLDHIAFTAKFQLECMAKQIRFYKSRHQQQRTLIEKLKREVAELKTIQGDSSGYASLEDGGGYVQQSMAYQPIQMELNHNGKRPYNEEDTQGQQQRRRPQTTSSPIAQAGPDRITLGQNQQPPPLVPEQSEERPHPAAIGGLSRRVVQANIRPGTSLAAQYAYNPPSTPQFKPQQLSRTQAAPQAFKRTKPSHPQIANNRNLAMGPPPIPQYIARGQGTGAITRNPTQRSMNVSGAQQVMGPPPTPQGNRFKPATQASSLQPPPSAMGRGPQRFVVPLMKENTAIDSGGNRIRFAPGANGQR